MFHNKKFIAATGLDDDAIAQSQTVLSATTLTLNGALVTSAGIAILSSWKTGRRISIYSSGNDSAVYFKIVGINQDNTSITDVILGGSGTTVYSNKYFYSISSITTSAACAGTVKSGIVAASSTYPIVGSATILDRMMRAKASVTGIGYGSVILRNGIAYECIVAHTSGTTTEPGFGTYWYGYWRKLDHYVSFDIIPEWVTSTAYVASATLTYSFQGTDEYNFDNDECKWNNIDDTTCIDVALSGTNTQISIPLSYPIAAVRSILTAYTSGALCFDVKQTH